MTKVKAVVLASNLYLPAADPDEKPVKYFKGDQVDLDEQVAEELAAGDEEAGRDPRLTIVHVAEAEPAPKKRGRKAAVDSDAD